MCRSIHFLWSHLFLEFVYFNNCSINNHDSKQYPGDRWSERSGLKISLCTSYLKLDSHSMKLYLTLRPNGTLILVRFIAWNNHFCKLLKWFISRSGHLIIRQILRGHTDTSGRNQGFQWRYFLKYVISQQKHRF